MSPAISWGQGPSGTQSYAVVFKDITLLEITDPSDPDYNHGYHWAIWDIPYSAGTKTLPANGLGASHEVNVTGIANARQWATFGYSFFPSCPNAVPALETDVTDSYSFVVYALPTLPPLPIPTSVADGTDTVRAMDGYFQLFALAAAEYRGTSDAHATEFDPPSLPTSLPPCIAGQNPATPADCIEAP